MKSRPSEDRLENIASTKDDEADPLGLKIAGPILIVLPKPSCQAILLNTIENPLSL